MRGDKHTWPLQKNLGPVGILDLVAPQAAKPVLPGKKTSWNQANIVLTGLLLLQLKVLYKPRR